MAKDEHTGDEGKPESPLDRLFRQVNFGDEVRLHTRYSGGTSESRDLTLYELNNTLLILWIEDIDRKMSDIAHIRPDSRQRTNLLRLRHLRYKNVVNENMQFGSSKTDETED